MSAMQSVAGGSMKSAVRSAVPSEYESPRHGIQSKPLIGASLRKRTQLAETKRTILAEQLSPATRVWIVELYLEALITRNKHGMELSKYVQRKINRAGFDETLIDAVVGGTLAEVRTELAVYRTEVDDMQQAEGREPFWSWLRGWAKGLAKRAKLATAGAWECI